MRHVRRFFVAIIFLMVAFALFVLITGAHPGTIIKISWHEVYIFMIVGALLLTVGAEIRQRMRARQMNLFISKLRQLQSNKTDQSHILLSPNDDYYELANTINDVQSWNRHKIQQLERQENELNALMDNMPVGAIQLAADRRIISLNLRAANLLNVATRVIGRPYDDVVNSHALMSFLERALLEKRHLHQTIELESRGETRTIDVTAEYYQTQENQFALWVLFYDVTELARLQTMQSQFVANASHELRTPLTAISGFTDTLLMGAQDDPEARQEFLEIIQRESARLLALIEDILALARMDSKHVDVKLELSQPAVVVEDILVSQQAAIAQSQLEVRVAIDTAQQLNLPSGLLRQILSNLIVNSIKYNQHHGLVDIASQVTENSYVITIKDTGLGISSEDQNHIFERFYRADKSRNQQIPGTGLGLAIVNDLVLSIGGNIDLTSQRGVGTTIQLTFPISVLNE